MPWLQESVKTRPHHINVKRITYQISRIHAISWIVWPNKSLAILHWSWTIFSSSFAGIKKVKCLQNLTLVTCHMIIRFTMTLWVYLLLITGKFLLHRICPKFEWFFHPGIFLVAYLAVPDSNFFSDSTAGDPSFIPHVRLRSRCPTQSAWPPRKPRSRPPSRVASPSSRPRPP